MSTAPIDPSVWAGVTGTIAAYAHALDSGRAADVAATFTSDGVSEIKGFARFEGHEALAEGYRGLAPTGPQLHLVANTVVSSTDESHATAVSSLAFFSRGESGWALQMTGGYEDTLRLENGRWLFTERITTVAP
jgi:hypothetical protein